ncbi:hypothetical protein ACTA71_004419 [Dictyostelium dimigraforme]
MTLNTVDKNNIKILDEFNYSKIIILFDEIGGSLKKSCEISKDLQLNIHIPIKFIFLVDLKTIFNKINKIYIEIKLLIDNKIQLLKNNSNNELISQLNVELKNKIIKIESISNELFVFLISVLDLTMVEIIHFEENNKYKILFIEKRKEIEKYQNTIQEINIFDDLEHSNNEKEKLIRFLEVSIQRSILINSHFKEIKNNNNNNNNNNINNNNNNNNYKNNNSYNSKNNNNNSSKK